MLTMAIVSPARASRCTASARGFTNDGELGDRAS
jgi:hypothetical protein